MQQWEYKIVMIDTRGYYAVRPSPRDDWNWQTGENQAYTQLAALGDEGWEVASVGAWTPISSSGRGFGTSHYSGDGAITVFKRPKQGDPLTG